MQKTDKNHEYFEAIDIPSRLRRRAESITHEVDKLTTGIFGSVLDIFVGNYISKQGGEEYDSLWLFAKGLLVEAQNFTESDQFRLIPLRGNVTYFEIKKRDFTFNDSTAGGQMDQARMQVVLKTGPETHCEINAAKQNCRYLAQLVQRYFVPNIQASKPRDSTARSIGSPRSTTR